MNKFQHFFDRRIFPLLAQQFVGSVRIKYRNFRNIDIFKLFINDLSSDTCSSFVLIIYAIYFNIKHISIYFNIINFYLHVMSKNKDS